MCDHPQAPHAADPARAPGLALAHYAHRTLSLVQRDGAAAVGEDEEAAAEGVVELGQGVGGAVAVARLGDDDGRRLRPAERLDRNPGRPEELEERYPLELGGAIAIFDLDAPAREFAELGGAQRGGVGDVAYDMEQLPG
jgi:hypothetical protein